MAPGPCRMNGTGLKSAGAQLIESVLLLLPPLRSCSLPSILDSAILFWFAT